MKTFSLALIALVLTGALNAATEPVEAPSVAPPATAIDLKTKSVFKPEEVGRNPFWPIGFKPIAKSVTTTEHIGPAIPESAFLVSSITLDHGARFAIVNGKAMQEGQLFGLQLGNQTYQITLKTIEDGRVILMRRDQEIIVPLRRK